MSVCCCSNPACMLYGCQAWRVPDNVSCWPTYQPRKTDSQVGTYDVKPVSEERIREILREEIGRVFPK